MTFPNNTIFVDITNVGPQGAAGVGVPMGGTAGQALVKASNANYDTEWGAGGGGGVPGGADGQIQYNNAGSFGGYSLSGGLGVVNSKLTNQNFQSLGSYGYTQYMQDNGLPQSSSAGEHTANIQNWLLYAQLLSYKNRPSTAGDNITQRTYIEAVYPRGGYGPDETTHVNCPIVNPPYVAINYRERMLREGTAGTATAFYTGDTSSQALKNLQMPTLIITPMSHQIDSIDINCNSNGTDFGSGVYTGKAWVPSGVTLQAGGTGYSVNDVLLTVNPDVYPYTATSITVNTVNGSGVILTCTMSNAGCYSLPPILQQRQWTVANATFCGFAKLGQVFDPAHAGWYKTTGGTGTGAEFTMAWVPDFAGDGTPYNYNSSAQLICNTFLDRMSIQQAGTDKDATYGPTFAFGITGLNYDFQSITSGGGYYGFYSNGASDIHGGFVNPVNAVTGVKIANGGGIEFTAIIDSPTSTGIEIDGAAGSIDIRGYGINVSGALTGKGAIVIGGDASLSSNFLRPQAINIDMVLNNLGGASVPALYCDHMIGSSSFNIVACNTKYNGNPTTHPFAYHTQFGANNLSIGKITGSIDAITGSIFAGTVPKEGIRVWDASIKGWAIGSGAYQLTGAGAPTDGVTGVNKAGISSTYSDLTNGPIYYGSTDASSPTWNKIGAGGVSGRITFQAAGVLAAASDICNWLVATTSGVIDKAYATAKTAPTGQAAIFDILKSTDGGSSFTSIWDSTPANRIQISAGMNNGTQTSFDTTTFNAGDIFRIDIAQAGSGAAGSNATVELAITQTS